jgi:hypothetical protein
MLAEGVAELGRGALTSCPLQPSGSRGTLSPWSSSSRPSRSRRLRRPIGQPMVLAGVVASLAGRLHAHCRRFWRAIGGALAVLCWLLLALRRPRAWRGPAGVVLSLLVDRPQVSRSTSRSHPPIPRRPTDTCPSSPAHRRQDSRTHTGLHLRVVSGASTAGPRFQTPQRPRLCASLRSPFRSKRSRDRFAGGQQCFSDATTGGWRVQRYAKVCSTSKCERVQQGFVSWSRVRARNQSRAASHPGKLRSESSDRFRTSMLNNTLSPHIFFVMLVKPFWVGLSV